MKVLHLPLKAKWYEMIESGEKKEEYREIKQHWFDRLIDCMFPKSSFLATKYFGLDSRTPQLHNIKNDFDGEWLCFKRFDLVKFSYGYTKRTMTFKIEDITIRKGNPEWGADPKEYYFVIKLGKRYE